MIKAPAIKTTKGVVSVKPPSNHQDVKKKDIKAGGTGKGERGFIAGKEFVGRQEAKKIAKDASQANVKGPRGLHSSDVFKQKRGHKK